MTKRTTSTLSGLCCLVLLALAVVAPVAAVDTVLLEFGISESDENAERYGGAARWNLGGKWLKTGDWELVSYLEERYPDLASLQEDFPPYGAYGYNLMLDVALAYSRTGNPQRLNDALQRVLQAHEQLRTEGVDNDWFDIAEAAYLAMTGDLESSLKHLDDAISGGLITSSRIVSEWPALEPLEGDPRFEAIQALMIEHLNSEREKLGLEPATI